MSIFRPTGKTHCIAVTNTSGGVQITNPTKASAYRFSNVDNTHDIFIAFNTASLPTAVVPTAGSPQEGICIQANSDVVLMLNADGYIAAISPNAGPHNLYITPGDITP